MSEMDFVDWSRAQFALTAIYHFLFVPLTLGLSFIIAIMETIYVKTGDKAWLEITKFWREKPETMLKKVAESQALRKAFDISGLYSVDEVGENEDKDDKLPQKLQTPKTQNLNELLSSSERPNSSVGTKNSQTEYIEAAPIEVEIATVKENLTVEPMPHDLLQSELVKRGASETEAEKLVERLSIDEATAYLNDPSSIDALMENLRG